MNILIFSTSTNNTNTFIGSLECVGEHEVSVMRYDEKWHRAAMELNQTNKDLVARINHPDPAQRFHFPRERVEMDAEMLQHAKLSKPDAIIYISAWEGDFVPLNETLGELNSIAPMVHFLCDAADPPWWDQLKEFERRQCFSLTVAIDGNQNWPGGRDWKSDEWHLEKALTLLTPLDTRFFPGPVCEYRERPYPIGYAGNPGGHFRSALIQRMQAVRGFAFKQRDDNPNSYAGFADFLRHTRVSISLPFTGSGATRHVKGRVLESAMAGCCLLEWENEATASWFAPRGEYWPYSSIEEAAELAEWLAAHPKIAGETAEALQETVMAEHSPKMFWGEVLGTLKGEEP